MRKKILLMLILALTVSTNVANADFTFGEPTNLGPAINSADLEVVPSISPDGLELYFIRAGEAWVARRETPDAEWEPASSLGSTVNSLSDAGIPCISADGLSLYFTSKRPGGSGDSDLWVTRRATHNDPWGDPENLGPTINSASMDWHSSISTDGLELYFSSNRPSGYGGDDLWVTRRATTDTPWGEPENLGSILNSSEHDACPSISADDLLLFFTSWQSDGYGSNFGLCDVFVARRATTKDPWGPPMNLGPVVNSPYIEWGMSVSADGSMLYFHSNRPGSEGPFDIWQAQIIPIVDLNGDGIVNAEDMCIIVDHWGTDEPLCDIGPMPWGDGIVDVQDLIVLAEHLFEETTPTEPVE
jgi:Tol biopolymer transport system component